MLWFLEANPNPEIAMERGVRLRRGAGRDHYPELLQRILNLGMRGAGD